MLDPVAADGACRINEFSLSPPCASLGCGRISIRLVLSFPLVMHCRFPWGTLRRAAAPPPSSIPSLRRHSRGGIMLQGVWVSLVAQQWPRLSLSPWTHGGCCRASASLRSRAARGDLIHAYALTPCEPASGSVRKTVSGVVVVRPLHPLPSSHLQRPSVSIASHPEHTSLNGRMIDRGDVLDRAVGPIETKKGVTPREDGVAAVSPQGCRWSRFKHE